MVEHAHKTVDRLGGSFASSPYRPSGQRFAGSFVATGITEVARVVAVIVPTARRRVGICATFAPCPDVKRSSDSKAQKILEREVKLDSP